MAEVATRRLLDRGATAVGRTARGPAHQELATFVREMSVDLLVVGSRGLSAIERFMLGSTSAALVGQPPTNVLVARRSPGSLAARWSGCPAGNMLSAPSTQRSATRADAKTSVAGRMCSASVVTGGTSPSASVLVAPLDGGDPGDRFRPPSMVRRRGPPGVIRPGDLAPHRAVPDGPRQVHAPDCEVRQAGLVPAGLAVKEAQPETVGDGFRARAHLQLPVDVLEVGLDGIARHEERRGDLAVGQATCEEAGDLAFPLGEIFVRSVVTGERVPPHDHLLLRIPRAGACRDARSRLAARPCPDQSAGDRCDQALKHEEAEQRPVERLVNGKRPLGRQVEVHGEDRAEDDCQEPRADPAEDGTDEDGEPEGQKWTSVARLRQKPRPPGPSKADGSERHRVAGPWGVERGDGRKHGADPDRPEPGIDRVDH